MTSRVISTTRCLTVLAFAITLSLSTPAGIFSSLQAEQSSIVQGCIFPRNSGVFGVVCPESSKNRRQTLAKTLANYSLGVLKMRKQNCVWARQRWRAVQFSARNLRSTFHKPVASRGEVRPQWSGELSFPRGRLEKCRKLRNNINAAQL